MNNRIRTYLRKRSMSQDELAQRCGISRQTLINIMDGKTKKIKLSLADKISKELRADIYEIFQI